jgi:hypothetical protein
MTSQDDSCDTGAQQNYSLPVHDYRDPTYYFDDGNLLLLVDGTLFNVSRSVFLQKALLSIISRFIPRF